MCVGAGDGNRTHVASLEGWNSTIELHPRMGDDGAVDETRTRDLHLGKVALYQLSYYRKTMGDRRRRGKQALMKTGAGEETRTHTPVAPDPKSGASAIPPRPHAVTTRMALRLPTPKSGRLFIILYAPSLVNTQTPIFFHGRALLTHHRFPQTTTSASVTTMSTAASCSSRGTSSSSARARQRHMDVPAAPRRKRS